MRATTTLLGVLASLVMLAVSGVMNYLFLSSLGKTPLEGQVLGAASAAADGLKALLPFFIVWAWRAGRISVALPGLIAWLFFSGFSLLSAIGFAADNRGVFSHTRESLNAAYESAISELRAVEARRADLPKHRPAAIVTEEIERHKQDRRWGSSRACAEATLPESREFCERYYALRGELASGVESGRLERAMGVLTGETERLRSAGAGQNTDPQVSLLSRLLGDTEDRVRFGLILVVALLVEIGSSLGLFLSTSHGALGRSTPLALQSIPEPSGETHISAGPPLLEGRRIGAIEDFCLACLGPAETAELTLTKLYQAYRGGAAGPDCSRYQGQNLKRHLE